MPTPKREWLENLLNSNFREQIRLDSNIEVAYGRMIVKFCYRWLDGFTYEWIPRLERSSRRGITVAETDVCIEK